MKVSIIIPVYQAHDTIGECLGSVVRQTLADWQLILVDDGSTDGSAGICDCWAATDPRITVVHQPNQGRSAARAEGVRHARGEWVCFVDADDTLPPDSLSRLCRAATDDVDIVLGNGYTLPGEPRQRIAMDEFRHLAVRGEGTIGVPWGALYRRSVLTDALFDLPRDIYNGEDYIFWLRLVFATQKPVNVVSEKVYLKGEEHTSNTFVWTASYAQRLDHYRLQAIPASQRDAFLPDILSDRIANLFDVAVCSPRSEWAHSAFMQTLRHDMARAGRSFTLRQRLFLAIPSLRLRKKVAA